LTDAHCHLLEKMLVLNSNKDLVSIRNDIEEKKGPLTFDEDLLKTWVEENLDLYKVREYYTLPQEGHNANH
jgi:hypothetical protein